MAGVLIEDSTNLHFEGSDDLDFAFPAILDPPSGGEQTANVVITGNSSGLVFKAFSIGAGPGKSSSPSSANTVPLKQAKCLNSKLDSCDPVIDRRP